MTDNTVAFPPQPDAAPLTIEQRLDAIEARQAEILENQHACAEQIMKLAAWAQQQPSFQRMRRAVRRAKGAAITPE